MSRRWIAVARAAVFVISLLAFGVTALAAERHVPTGYPTIQAAVDAAIPGDTILVAPGVYYEQVHLTHRSSLTIRGTGELRFLDDEACFDAVARDVRGTVLVGTIYLLSSVGVRIEGLTIIGPGPTVFVEGIEACYTTDVSVRYCNLVSYHGPAIRLGSYHRRVAVACTNAQMRDGVSPLVATGELNAPVDSLLSCTRATYDVESIDFSAEAVDEVIVAVIDSGIDRSLPELACRIWRNPGEIPDNGIDDDSDGYVDDVHGWDFRDQDGDSLVGSTLHWHGTFVAGQIIHAVESRADSDSPCTVKIMDLRFLDEDGLFYTSDWGRLASAVDYAVAHGARIINLSLYASRYPPDEVHAAIRRAADAGVAVIAVAGNDAGPLGPIAQWSEVISVGAVDRSGQQASFSSGGEGLDFVSYGVEVLGLIPGGRLVVGSGTSFSTPRVAGVAAFHLAEQPDLSLTDLMARLVEEATDLETPGWDGGTGWGLVE